MKRTKSGTHDVGKQAAGTRWTISLALGLALVAPLSGCGSNSGLERVSVSGAVTYRGEPVQEGRIRFVPRAGTIAPMTIEAVRDGRYSTETSGGVPVGSFRVEILSYDPNEPAPAGPGAPPRKQFLPAKYNVQSTLELETESGQSEIVRDFILAP